MKNLICSFALVGAALVASANASEMYGDYSGDTYTTPRPASYYTPTVSGDVSIAYNSKYAFHDIVASDEMNKDGVLWFDGLLNLPLYTGEQHIEAAYGILSDGALKPHGSLTLDWSADWEIFPNLRAGFGYEFNWRGLRGYLAQVRGKATHGVYHGVDAYLTYDDPGRGYFGNLSLQGGVYGLTGWLVEADAGKRWNGILIPNADLELSAGVALSCGYWAGGVDGVDQVNVKLALPVKLDGASQNKGIKIVPFVQTAWAGNTRSRIRTRVHRSVFDTFQFLGGVAVEYQF